MQDLNCSTYIYFDALFDNAPEKLNVVKKVGGLCTFSQTVSVCGTTDGTFLWRFEFMNIAIGTSDHHIYCYCVRCSRNNETES